MLKIAGDNSLPFMHYIKAISSQIGERFLFSIRPQDFSLVKPLMSAQPEMYAQIML